MPAPFNTIDLATLSLKAGQARQLEIEIQPEGLNLGGEYYGFTGDAVEARLDVSRTTSGFAFRLRASPALEGRCMRCLAESDFAFSVDSREVHQPASGDEELESPYVDGDELDVSAWAHDAIALAVPQALLCRPDCAGLCPECGISLNDIEPGTHTHEKPPDPRWAKLRELMD